jgi:hypothetical protein
LINKKYVVKKVIVLSSNISVVGSEAEEAGDCFGQVQSVSSPKVRKDASHLPKPPPK